MIVGVPREILPGERRVALVPDAVKRLSSQGLEVVIEAGAGEQAGFADEEYAAAGARVEPDAGVVLGCGGVVVKVQPPLERPGGGHEVDQLTTGSTLIGFLRPLDRPELARRLADRGVTAFAMELIPRITRAQSMDALSAMSTLAGYRAVLLGAAALPKIFPMLVTAAGTILPARVLVIGAGVAGLQAIATARRLGAVVDAYDTRPAVKEQVESLGARFVELDLDTADAEDAGGYAKAQDEAFYVRQRQQLGKRVAASDVVVTTALVPGQRAPLLIDRDAVRGMRAGSVIVDLAAEQGGNCAGTEPDRTVVVDGVSIIGVTNPASEVPANASQMYAKNISTFLAHLTRDGDLALDLEDEITHGALLTYQGEIVNEAARARADAPPAEPSLNG
ncbi:MAG: Re/Si-specific NAD(P)(+) transhydrogenase subunit alpha [Myxococcota bacterium]